MSTALLTPDVPVGSAAWNRALNLRHDMAGLRARGGRVVRAIEARRRRGVVARVLAGRPRLVVDVGCEDGWMAEAYAGRVERVVLADLDGEVLSRARAAARANVATVVANACAPRAIEEAVGRGRADVVVLSALLEHLPEPAAALRALAPLLRPGGRFVIYVPADGPILLLKAVLRATRLGARVRGLPLQPAPGHLHRFDRRRLAGLLGGRGTVEEIAFDPLCLGYHAVLRVP